jgi:hypothetical protein
MCIFEGDGLHFEKSSGFARRRWFLGVRVNDIFEGVGLAI